MYPQKRTAPHALRAHLIIAFIVLILIPITVFCANQTPTVGTVTPASGASIANIPIVFTTTLSDADGWQNIQYVYFLLNTSTQGTNCFYGYYNQNTNLLYLRNDANNAWLGGFAPGSTNVIENSYAKLNCQTTTVTGSGTTMTVVWNVTFKDTFASNLTRFTYLYVRDDTNAYANLTQKGTYIIDKAPSVGTVTPTQGLIIAPNTLSLASQYIDPDGAQYITNAYLQLGTSRGYVYYSKSTNKLYLINDSGSTFTGGYAPGTANIIENSYIKLDCSKTTYAVSGNILTVTWSLTLKDPLATATYSTKLYGINSSNLNSGWVSKGEACVARQAIVPTN